MTNYEFNEAMVNGIKADIALINIDTNNCVEFLVAVNEYKYKNGVTDIVNTILNGTTVNGTTKEYSFPSTDDVLGYLELGIELSPNFHYIENGVDMYIDA